MRIFRGRILPASTWLAWEKLATQPSRPSWLSTRDSWRTAPCSWTSLAVGSAMGPRTSAIHWKSMRTLWRGYWMSLIYAVAASLGTAWVAHSRSLWPRPVLISYPAWFSWKPILTLAVAWRAEALPNRVKTHSVRTVSRPSFNTVARQGSQEVLLGRGRRAFSGRHAACRLPQCGGSGTRDPAHDSGAATPDDDSARFHRWAASLPAPKWDALPNEGVLVLAVPDAGHSMAFENPGGVAEAINTALDS